MKFSKAWVYPGVLSALWCSTPSFAGVARVILGEPVQRGSIRITSGIDRKYACNVTVSNDWHIRVSRNSTADVCRVEGQCFEYVDKANFYTSPTAGEMFAHFAEDKKVALPLTPLHAVCSNANCDVEGKPAIQKLVDCASEEAKMNNRSVTYGVLQGADLKEIRDPAPPIVDTPPENQIDGP